MKFFKTNPHLTSKDGHNVETPDRRFNDASANRLSYVGQAAYKALRKKHRGYHHRLWNVTSGKVVGNLQYTPRGVFNDDNGTTEDPKDGHDDWFVDEMCNMIRKTEMYCDIMSLAPPDGMFKEKMQQALLDLNNKTMILGKIRIRMLFGHVIGTPVDCDTLVQELTALIPKNSKKNIQLWIGAWRKGVTSWNHAKLIAVDGQYLHTGGHNMWDYHYLKHDPVHDLSFEMEGNIANDAHLFANEQWSFIEKHQVDKCGCGVVAPCSAMAMESLVSVCEYPAGKTAMLPPCFGREKKRNSKMSMSMRMSQLRDSKEEIKNKIQQKKETFKEKILIMKQKIKEKKEELLQQTPSNDNQQQQIVKIETIGSTADADNIKNDNKPSNPHVPVISIGRTGAMLGNKDRPADDAILAMLDSAQHTVRLAIQDLGPICLLPTKIAVPGYVWPKKYLSALGRAIWNNDAHVEIVLSNPNSIPGGLSPLEANYGNGWSCVDVAAEIIKTIKLQFPKASDSELRNAIKDNLRVCFIRTKQGQKYSDGQSIGLHSKHFIIDDRCCYIGSQNLYLCDLAEWGVVIDDVETVLKIKEDYWDQLWSTSFTGEDVDVKAVMDGLKINRDGEDVNMIRESTRAQMDNAIALANRTNYRNSKSALANDPHGQQPKIAAKALLPNDPMAETYRTDPEMTIEEQDGEKSDNQMDNMNDINNNEQMMISSQKNDENKEQALSKENIEHAPQEANREQAILSQ